MAHLEERMLCQGLLIKSELCGELLLKNYSVFVSVHASGFYVLEDWNYLS